MKADMLPPRPPWNLGELYGQNYFVNPHREIEAIASRDKDERPLHTVARSKTFVDAALWPEFQEPNAALVAFLSEFTDRVIRGEVHRETGEAEKIDEPPQIGR